MNKRSLTEQEICSRHIRPAIVEAGWDDADNREQSSNASWR
jgi:type I site-specific restriction endonuclease